MAEPSPSRFRIDRNSGTRGDREHKMRTRSLEVGGTEAIKQLVPAGIGVAIVSPATLSDQIALDRVGIIELRDFILQRTLARRVYFVAG